jgi:hypothetical protein
MLSRVKIKLNKYGVINKKNDFQKVDGGKKSDGSIKKLTHLYCRSLL